MYYSGLNKVIRDLEEKKFYDIALLFLSAKGYPDLVIVDGTGDGGRDVASKWEHIRIQLSVRRDWDKKINNEAKLALDKGAKHFIYVTNRRIKDHERDQFLQNGFQYKDRVEITIYDLAAISTSLNRLRSKGGIKYQAGGFQLSADVKDRIKLSRDDFERARTKDLDDLAKNFNLNRSDAESLVRISLEILARKETFDGDAPYTVQLQEFIVKHGFQRKRMKLYEVLSKLTSARIAVYGDAISHILSTNTYDIFRSLGRSNSITAVLDSSVAMPMLFGLSFSNVKSRYGIGASALNEMCKAHKFKLVVPKPYLNKMASHGLKATEYIDIYNLIGDESRSVLRASGNSYLSHYAHIRDDKLSGTDMSIGEFLLYFGIEKRVSLAKVKRRIEQLLNALDVEVVTMPRWKPELRAAISELKPNEVPIILDHDASVLTMFSDTTDEGYIFATWDKHLTELVELKSRIYADTPSRVVDFLSMANGAEFETEQTVSLLDSLVYCDEKKAEALARKIEAIRSSETAYELQRFTDAARKRSPDDRESADIVSEFFAETENRNT